MISAKRTNAYYHWKIVLLQQCHIALTRSLSSVHDVLAHFIGLAHKLNIIINEKAIGVIQCYILENGQSPCKNVECPVLLWSKV